MKIINIFYFLLMALFAWREGAAMAEGAADYVKPSSITDPGKLKFAQAESDPGQVLSKAKAGDPEAEYEMGCRFLYGLNEAFDQDQAVLWLQKAVDQGYLPAYVSLGCAIQMNIGKTKDQVVNESDAYQVYCIFQQGAQKGDMNCQGGLGVALLYGNGCLANPAQGIELLKKAAEGGDPYSSNTLGTIYEEGVFVPQDFTLAEKWYQLAMAQGDEDAHDNWFNLPYRRQKAADQEALPQDVDRPYGVMVALDRLYRNSLEQTGSPEAQNHYHDWIDVVDSVDYKFYPTRTDGGVRERLSWIFGLGTGPLENAVEIWQAMAALYDLAPEAYQALAPTIPQKPLSPAEYEKTKEVILKKFRTAGLLQGSLVIGPRPPYREEEFKEVSEEKLFDLQNTVGHSGPRAEALQDEIFLRGEDPAMIKTLLAWARKGEDKDNAYFWLTFWKVREAAPVFLDFLQHPVTIEDDDDGDGGVVLPAGPVQPDPSQSWTMLGDIGDRSMAAPLVDLYQKTENPSPEMELCLAKLGAAQIVPRLIEELQSSSRPTQLSAAQALGLLRDVRAREPFKAFLTQLFREQNHVRLNDHFPVPTVYRGMKKYGNGDDASFLPDDFIDVLKSFALLPPDPSDGKFLKDLTRGVKNLEIQWWIQVIDLENKMAGMDEPGKCTAIENLESENLNTQGWTQDWALSYLGGDFSPEAGQTLEKLFNDRACDDLNDPYVTELTARGVRLIQEKVYATGVRIGPVDAFQAVIPATK